MQRLYITHVVFWALPIGASRLKSQSRRCETVIRPPGASSVGSAREPRVAAELAGRDDIGELSAGARADLVVVAGDPTLEITDSRRIEAVWFGGEPVDLDLAWERVAEAIEAAAAAFGG